MTISVALLPDEGAPQVGVTVTGLSSPAVISVQVSWTRNEWHSVIGAQQVEVFGSAFFRDHLVPLNLEATYRVVIHSGSIVGGDTDTVTVLSDWTWIQDPLDPRAAIRVECEHADDGGVLMVGSFAAAQYRQSVDFAQPMGARLPVGSIGQRLMAGQVPLVVKYDVAAEGGDLQRLLMDAGNVVIRGNKHGFLEPVAHVTAGDVTEERRQTFDANHTQVSTWNLNVTQVRPGNLRVVIAWWTHAAVAELWAPSTYADVYAARPGRDYLDWQADPDLP